MKRLERIRRDVVSRIVTKHGWYLGAPRGPGEEDAGYQDHLGRHMLRQTRGQRRQIVTRLLNRFARQAEAPDRP